MAETVPATSGPSGHRWPSDLTLEAMLQEGRDVWIATVLGVNRALVSGHRARLGVKAHSKGGNSAARSAGWDAFFAKWAPQLRKEGLTPMGESTVKATPPANPPPIAIPTRATHQEPAADNHLLPDDALRQLLTECPSNRAAIILKIDRHLIAGLRERLAAPDPWPGRPYPYLLAAGRIAQQRWGMWQETIPPPIGHEDLEQLITSESARGMTATPGADPLTTFGVLAAIRTFHDEHDRWPTRAELAVAMRRAELDVKSKLGLLTKQGYIDQDGQTFVPTDTAPASPQVTVTKWTREEIEAKFAQFAADKAPVSSPWANRPKALARTAKRPAVTTPQEVQEEMPTLTKDQQKVWDDDRAIVALAESIADEGKNVGDTLVEQFGTTIKGVTNRLYRARQRLRDQGVDVASLRRGRRPGSTPAPAQTAPAAPPPDDDDLFAPDPPAPPITPPVVAALAPEQALGGDGSTEHTDASEGLTTAQEGTRKLTTPTVAEFMAARGTPLPTDETAGDADQTRPFATGRLLMRNLLADVAASCCSLDFPATLPVGGLVNGETYTMVPKAEHEATQKRIVDLEIEAMQLPEKRNLLAAKQGTIDKLEADNAELRAVYEGLVASYHNLQVATANNANVASLMAENADLQAGLKEALQVIEQAATDQGSVTYLVMDNEPGSPPDVLPMTADDVLGPCDEWPRLIMFEGKRRYDMWHCIETLALPGGNIVCILRPGAAETAGQEAA